ncbi:hypothetical protein Q8A73_015611 [Channa argus]|nr:hypothetical protein Q8A73_015611 [Channa argus]
MTLWDRDDLIKHIGERQQNYNDFEIVASESIEDKSSALNVEASLKASFLPGVVEVEGSAKYLNDSKTSRNQARVTLKYKATTKVQELSMNHLGRGNVKHPYVFDKGLATHVVTAVLYGAQAFFVFDREVSVKENHQDVQGNLKVMIKKIPTLTTSEGSLKLEEQDRANVENFSCRFYGDFSLQKTPSSFQDAVEVYQSLPKLLGANGENAVPMKQAQRVLEDLSELEIRTTTVQQFPQIGEKIKCFKERCSEFRLEFQQTLGKKLPLIRGGGEDETVLVDLLKKRHSSPFNNRNLSEWMNCKEREIYTLKSFTNTMKNTMIVPSQNHLYKESFRVELVCFVFTSLGSPDLYLSALSEYLKGRTKPDDPQHPHTHDVEEGQWYSSKEALDEVRSKAKVFSDFAEANKENQNIKFLTVGLKDEKQKGSSIYLYKDGFSVSENFEPPSKPETVTISDINHNCVTLKVSPPRFGAENISSYSVEYCVSGEDGWQRKTASTPGEVTVSELRLNTEYMFRCRAVTSVGVGPANEVEILVSWEKAAELGQDVHILSYVVEYATTDNRVKEEDLDWNQTMSRPEKAIISELDSETEYFVRVRCDCGVAGSSKKSISVLICTTLSTRLAEVHRCTSERINSESPSIYKLPLEEEDVHVSGCRRYNIGKSSLMQNCTILLFGSIRIVQAALAELTPTQKDLFDAVRSIFDRDVTQNFRVLVTFTDGQLLPVLEAINTSGVPCPKRDDRLPVHFRFNNSALFARNKSSVANNTGSDVDTDEDEVLRERQQLENSVGLLWEQVKDELAKLQEINETIQKLNKHEAEICRNKIFEFEVTVTKPVQVDVSPTEDFFTNCQQCHMTCHYPHGDDGKTGCATLGSDGRCTVCPGKCYWNVHFIQKFRWDYKEVKENRTVKELKEKYLKAAEDRNLVWALTHRLRAERDVVWAELKKQLEISAEGLNRLK